MDKINPNFGITKMLLWESSPPTSQDVAILKSASSAVCALFAIAFNKFEKTSSNLYAIYNARQNQNAFKISSISQLFSIFFRFFATRVASGGGQAYNTKEQFNYLKGSVRPFRAIPIHLKILNKTEKG